MRSLAGTNVAWDFVELPSQIMENWCWEREALDLFARHYETGEPIPDELLPKMKRARTFRGANAPDAPARLRLRRSRAARGLLAGGGTGRGRLQPPDSRRSSRRPRCREDHAMIAGFTHLFADPVGYAAGYYSYKWAEVLDADAFTRFRADGIFDRRPAAASARRSSPEGTARTRRSSTAPSWAAIPIRPRCWSGWGWSTPEAELRALQRQAGHDRPAVEGAADPGRKEAIGIAGDRHHNPLFVGPHVGTSHRDHAGGEAERAGSRAGPWHARTTPCS